MKRLLVVLVLCSLSIGSVEAQRRRAVGGTPPPPTPAPAPTPAPNPAPTPAPAPQFGAPLNGLTAAQLALFNAGREEFRELEDLDGGLGPVFNGRSCGECHNAPALGGSSPITVTRIGTLTNGTFDSLTRLGGSLLQAFGLTQADGSTHNFRREQVPPAATIVTRRRSTPIFGLAFVDATPDATFIALAAQQAARNDGTAGRAPLVDNFAAGMRTIGKFGWKAQVPTLHQFAGDAYLNELGVTNPEFPNENCPSGDCNELRFNPRPGLNDGGEGVRALLDFMAMLAAPPRGPITADVTAGEAVFNRIGCNACHVQSLQTGANAIAALNRVTYQPWSDFLLHDMGSLGDNIVQGDATGRELRTAPLWGLRVMPTLLHDGRARTIEEAVIAHDGQGRASRDRFNVLNATDRATLMAFLRSL